MKFHINTVNNIYIYIIDCGDVWVYVCVCVCVYIYIYMRAVIAQPVYRLDYGLDDRDSRFRYPAWAGNFSLHHRVQNVTGAHPVSTDRAVKLSTHVHLVPRSKN
jgi:hypothetical protein